MLCYCYVDTGHWYYGQLGGDRIIVDYAWEYIICNLCANHTAHLFLNKLGFSATK